ncbi:MAG: hypothetical protein N3A63_07045 [Bacteroidetes bacterium]|nr:hypothetical protein [Bacteroidota bacterium]
MNIHRALLAIVCSTQVVFAQFEGSGTISHLIDDNLDNNTLQLGDNVTVLELEVGYSVGEAHAFSVSYGAMYERYALYNERNVVLQHTSLNYAPSVFGDKTTLSFRGMFMQRHGKGYYTLFNHSLWNVYGEGEYWWNDNLSSSVTYEYSRLRFSELVNFNFNEHVLALQTAFYGSTRTTCIVRVHWCTKLYDPVTYTRTVIDTITVTAGTGRGQGGGGQQVLIELQPHTQVVTEDAAGTSQIIGLIRCAQGITSTTGLSITAQYQWAINKESRYFLSEFGSLPDDELFDNSYGYEGLFSSLMLTQVLPWDSKLRLMYSHHDRQYTSLTVSDPQNSSSVKRRDRRTIVGVHVEKEFGPVKLFGTFEYIRNNSNDPFYDYTNKPLRLVCTVVF